MKFQGLVLVNDPASAVICYFQWCDLHVLAKAERTYYRTDAQLYSIRRFIKSTRCFSIPKWIAKFVSSVSTYSVFKKDFCIGFQLCRLCMVCGAAKQVRVGLSTTFYFLSFTCLTCYPTSYSLIKKVSNNFALRYNFNFTFFKALPIPITCMFLTSYRESIYYCNKSTHCNFD